MTMLQPMPDREEAEREVRSLLTEGDIETIARWRQIDRSIVSREFNPDCVEKKSFVFRTIEGLWIFDAMREGLADRTLSIVTRRRLQWLPAPVVRTDPAKTTSKIGRELMEFIEKELQHVADDVLLKELQDVKDAVNVKMDEILSRREARLRSRD